MARGTAESGETLAESDIEVGQIVEGVVTGITHFGAFVLLPDGKTGLVHISEIADSYVRDVREFLKENDPVKVKVLSFDGANKIALSIRQAAPRPAAPAFVPGGQGARTVGRPPRSGAGRPGPNRGTFEDKLTKFLKESDEKLTALRRHQDKRGHHGGRPAGH